jgi:uncharacterized cysteine cluster protein YcgN (CxxCxxCC family)
MRWEEYCLKCGLCCYVRHRGKKGEVIVEYSSPCEYLDEKTHLCTVYEKRFSVCSDCRKLTLYHALFSPYLPSTCGYVRRFRFWRNSKIIRTEMPPSQDSY